MPFWLVKKNNLFAASFILMALTFSAATAFATIGQGIRDIALVTFPVIYIFAGLTFNRTILRVCIAMSFISIGWLAFGEGYGWFVPRQLSGNPGLTEFIMAALVLSVAVMAVYLLTTRMRRNFERVEQELVQRKQVEKALRDSNAQMTRILENMQDAYFQTDKSGKFILVNRAAVRMFGYRSEEELFGMPATALYADSSERELMMANLMKSGYLNDWVVGGLRKDGTTFSVSMNVQFVRDEKEQIIGTEGSVRDISERKRAEEALNESNEIFNQFMAHSPVHVYIQDEKLKLLKASDSFKDLLGKPVSELIGKDSWELVPTEFAKSAIEDDLKVLQQGTSVKSEEILNGATYSTIKFPIHRGGGKADYLGAFSVDITELKRTEEALRESEELFRSQFDNRV